MSAQNQQNDPSNVPFRNPLKRASFLVSLPAGLATIALLSYLGLEGHLNVTGEEDYDNAVAFVPDGVQGDKRIERIVGLLRKSDIGKELHQYAVDHNLKFQWAKDWSRAGTYSQGLTKLSPYHSDKELSLTLVHEIRHHWNSARIGKLVSLDPDLVWKANLAQEVDSCAYTAHFAAQHKEQSGEDLLPSKLRYYTRAGNMYGIDTAISYAQLPPLKRDFYKHAVTPCFAEFDSVVPFIEQGYKQNIAQHFSGIYKIASEYLTNAIAQEDHAEIQSIEAHFTSATKTDVAQIIARQFTTDMSDNPQMPVFKGLSTDETMKIFDSLLMTDSTSEEQLALLKQEFSDMQKTVRAKTAKIALTQ